METPIKFYDSFAKKLIHDFLDGNPRTVAAITFASQTLKEANCASVLDLGCGIGWSTYEFCRACPDAQIYGLDLSPGLVTTAKAIFGDGNNRHYLQVDLRSTDWMLKTGQLVDSCVMLDVYEHIPMQFRKGFHQALSRVLGADATLIMTCPSHLHQEYLRREHPDGLQPVDEDVSLNDLQCLAADIGAEVAKFEYKSIWATNDYFHAVLCKGLERSAKINNRVRHRLLPQKARYRLVKNISNSLDEELRHKLKSPPYALTRRIRTAMRKVIKGSHLKSV